MPAGTLLVVFHVTPLPYKPGSHLPSFSKDTVSAASRCRLVTSGLHCFGSRWLQPLMLSTHFSEWSKNMLAGQSARIEAVRAGRSPTLHTLTTVGRRVEMAIERRETCCSRMKTV